MVLGLTQPPTEMNTGTFPRSKDGRFVGLTILNISFADYLEIWETQPPETFRACPGL